MSNRHWHWQPATSNLFFSPLLFYPDAIQFWHRGNTLSNAYIFVCICYIYIYLYMYKDAHKKANTPGSIEPNLVCSIGCKGTMVKDIFLPTEESVL